MKDRANMVSKLMTPAAQPASTWENTMPTTNRTE